MFKMKINKEIYVEQGICLSIIDFIVFFNFQKVRVFPICSSGINKVCISLKCFI